MKLSDRTRWDLGTTRLHAAVREHDGELLDLTVSNPTAAGLHHEPETYALLGDVANRAYAPDPRGLATAREAVAAYYGRRGIKVDPGRVWLTASTSEAYSHLFALLCDAGDGILVPRPGYPLLDHLTQLAGVEQRPYRLNYDGRWWLDGSSLGTARVVVVVAPGNPTGHVPEAAEATALRQAAPVMIVDEVFSDYPVELDADELARRRNGYGGRRFVLNGLSKVAALPGLKLSWVVAHGDGVEEALERAEVIADAYLSVATPVQRALPELLVAAEVMQDRIRKRLRHNLATLDRAIEGSPIGRLRVDAGWTAVLRLPEVMDDESWALRLLQRASALVAPGYLFDIDGPPRVAVSLLTPEAIFERGILRLVEAVSKA